MVHMVLFRSQPGQQGLGAKSWVPGGKQMDGDFEGMPMGILGEGGQPQLLGILLETRAESFQGLGPRHLVAMQKMR